MDDLGEYIDGWYINEGNGIRFVRPQPNEEHNHNLWTSKEWVESIQAQCKLVRLRDAWNEGWKPTWDNNQWKNVIVLEKGTDVKVERWCETSHFLVFPDRETAQEFLSTFRDLIETYFKPYKS